MHTYEYIYNMRVFVRFIIIASFFFLFYNFKRDACSSNDYYYFLSI